MPSVRAWILIGVAVRALLLVLASPIELQSDEAHYAWLGLGWERFGFLTDSQRFLWPPAYPFLHRLGFSLFEEHGVLAVRVLQVACSAATGWGVAALARRLIHERAAPWATALWAVHLPLAGFCVLGWPDSLCLALLLPSLALLYDAAQDLDTRKLVAAGVLLGVAALFKELSLAIALSLALWLCVHTYRNHRHHTSRATLTFLLAVFLPLAPWTARNLQHYSSPILSGSTLAENIYQGWNAHDRNFDVLPVVRSTGLDPRPDTSSALAFPIDTSTTWDRPGGPDLPARQAAKLHSGAQWVSTHPSDFLLSRVSKAAHVFAPLSFPVRHLALGHYGGPLGHGALARIFLVLATVQSLALLLFAAVALARHAPPHALFWIPVCVLLAQPLLVGMTRLRVPLIPFFLIAIAAGIVRTRPPRSILSGALAVAVLVFLLATDMRPILWLLQHAWEVSA